jgi:hypothetical protein
MQTDGGPVRRLMAAAERRGIDRRHLAAETGIPHETLSNWLRPNGRRPSPPHLARIEAFIAGGTAGPGSGTQGEAAADSRDNARRRAGDIAGSSRSSKALAKARDRVFGPHRIVLATDDDHGGRSYRLESAQGDGLARPSRFMCSVLLEVPAP